MVIKRIKTFVSIKFKFMIIINNSDSKKAGANFRYTFRRKKMVECARSITSMAAESFSFDALIPLVLSSSSVHSSILAPTFGQR